MPIFPRIAKQIEPILARIVEASDTDILLYNGEIERPSDREATEICCSRRRRPNLLLILVTDGGDPDAAYRIARCFQDRYDKFTCCIAGRCKSAGTLLSIGANELAFSVNGELGPLDIQMVKKDELWETESGLAVMTALTALHEKAQLAFEHFFISLSLKSRGRITVRTGSEIAAKLTEGLFAPITKQVDALHVGEAFRSMAIARDYGLRLIKKGRNIRSENLQHLISQYPSHGFVVDQREARQIFRSVRDCTEDENLLIEALEYYAEVPLESTVIDYLTREAEEPSNAQPAQETEGKAAIPRAAEPPAEAGTNAAGGDGARVVKARA